MSRGAQVAGCCAAALAPLAVLAVDPRGWSPYGPAKWLVVGVLGSAAVAGALVGGRLRLGRGPTVALAAFVAWAAVCAAVGDDRLYAWIGTPERHLGVATWAMCLGLLVVGSTLAADGARRVVGSVVAATAVLAASGMVELAGWQPGGLRTDERVLGPFGSSAYTGAASLLLVPVAVGVALDRSWSSRARAAAGAAAAGGLVVLVATGARAAVLGAVVAMALGTVAVRARRPGLGRATVAGLVAAAVVGVVAVAGITGAAGRWERLWSDRDGGARGRLDEWAVAARVVAANPVVGVGPEGYRIAFGAHVDAGYERRHGRAVLPDRAHAGPLDVAATTGLPGLALWGAAVVLVGRRVGRALQADGLRPAGASPGGAIAGRSAPPGGVEELRSGDPSSRDGSADQLHGDGPAPPWVVGVAIGLAAYLAGQLVLFPLAEVDPVAWLLAGALLAAVARPGELAEVALPRPVALVPAAVAGLVLVAGAADVVADRRARVAVDALDQGRSAVAVSAANDAARWRGDAVRYRLLAAEASVRAGGLTALGHALDEVDAALDVSPADPVVRGRQAQLLARRAGLTGQPAHLEAARRAWADVVDDDPRNASHRLAYGTVLAEVGDRPGAEAQWLRAEDLAPTAAAPSVDLALLYLAEGRTAEAVAAAERAVARAPGDPTALGALEAARQGAARTSEAVR